MADDERARELKDELKGLLEEEEAILIELEEADERYFQKAAQKRVTNEEYQEVRETRTKLMGKLNEVKTRIALVEMKIQRIESRGD